MKPIAEHVLFDLDGTLTDPALGITRCFAHALRQMDLPVPSEAVLHSYIGPPLPLTLAEKFGLQDGAVTQALALFRERFSTVGMYENEVYDSIPEALSSLREAGFTLYVATSKPVVYAREILRHFDLTRHFKGIYGSELSGERIKKEEVIAYLLAEEHIPAHEAIMIGDRLHDIEGARHNQLRAALGVTYGYGSAEELQSAGADALCQDPVELVRSVIALTVR